MTGGSEQAGSRVTRDLRWRLEITVEQTDGIRVLALAGRVSRTSAPHLAAAISGVPDHPGPRLVLDFALVDYISSAGLEVIETAAGRCAAARGTLVLAAVPEPVRIALELGGILDQVPIEASREQAIARAKAG
jgi:anti-anti-sigma factor